MAVLGGRGGKTGRVSILEGSVATGEYVEGRGGGDSGGEGWW